MSEKSSGKAPDYVVEPIPHGIALFFDPHCGVGLPIPLKSGIIRTNQD